MLARWYTLKRNNLAWFVNINKLPNHKKRKGLIYPSRETSILANRYCKIFNETKRYKSSAKSIYALNNAKLKLSFIEKQMNLLGFKLNPEKKV